jgi:hypothetical protein
VDIGLLGFLLVGVDKISVSVVFSLGDGMVRFRSISFIKLAAVFLIFPGVSSPNKGHVTLDLFAALEGEAFFFGRGILDYVNTVARLLLI